MADDIVLNAATRAALQNLQSLQGAALLGLKQAAQNDRAVADLIEQAPTIRAPPRRPAAKSSTSRPNARPLNELGCKFFSSLLNHFPPAPPRSKIKRITG